MNGKTTICATALLMALGACGGKEARWTPPADTVIRTAPVNERPLCEELLLNGRVTCDEGLLRKLYIPCTGKISGIRVEVGDRVGKGEVLATMNSQDAASCQQELNDTESQLRVAERALSMAQDLHAGGMLSDKELAAADEEVVRLQGARERLQAVAHINGYDGGSQARIISPIDGYVTARRVYNNGYVDEANNDTPAFEIADMSRVWVVADVYENDLSRVREGAAVRVTTLAWKDEAFVGKIDKIYHVLDDESKTMKVRVTLDNPDGKLVPGIFACVQVSVPSARPVALTVPSGSVVFEHGSHYVVVRRGKAFERRKVEVLSANDTVAWVSGSLHCGEQVVSHNALLVFNDLK